MVKRIAAAGLWLFALTWGFNYLSVILGITPVIGFALSAAFSAFVAVDPLHLFWPAPTPATAAPAREPVAVAGVAHPQA